MNSTKPPAGLAIIIGATGGIGAAVHEVLTVSGQYEQIWGTSRTGSDSGLHWLELGNEASIEALAQRAKSSGLDIRLVFDATGYLHGQQGGPEKSWSSIDPTAMAHQFAINTIGPALLMKHFLPLLPREGRSVFATISAKVGSISDNRLGGWYGYRAAKAGLNQLVRTAAVELARKRPNAICLALHPGTVATPLSDPFAKSNVHLQTPQQSATAMLGVIMQAKSEQSGSLVAYDGATISP